MKASQTQQDVLKRMIADGGFIHRISGGYWISGTPIEFSKTTSAPNVPWCGTQTIRAMERVGWIERTHQFTEAWRDIYRITDTGREAVAEQTGGAA